MTTRQRRRPRPQKRAESYTELLSRCYGLAGVADLYGGDWEDAYDRLQKAARCVLHPCLEEGVSCACRICMIGDLR